MTAMIANPPSSPVRCPSTNDMGTSATAPSPMRSSIGSCITVTDSCSKVNRCENDAPLPPSIHHRKRNNVDDNVVISDSPTTASHRPGIVRNRWPASAGMGGPLGRNTHIYSSVPEVASIVYGFTPSISRSTLRIPVSTINSSAVNPSRSKKLNGFPPT
jgi:hypothetical protein